MLLLRGATDARDWFYDKLRVSIHAPLARSNCQNQQFRRWTWFQYMLLLRGATFLRVKLAAGTSFQYMLLLRGATACGYFEEMSKAFQYMLLLRGATRSPFHMFLHLWVSIHAPLARSNITKRMRIPLYVFQYMLLLRGATQSQFALPVVNVVSIHAPLARSNTEVGIRWDKGNTVSIHAPLARSNTRLLEDSTPLKVSIHAPLARSNLSKRGYRCRYHGSFNTCSSCEEQRGYARLRRGVRGFNTCSSCEEQLRKDTEEEEEEQVSIHAPLARSNAAESRRDRPPLCFNTCSSCEEQQSCGTKGPGLHSFNTCSSCEEQPIHTFSGVTLCCFNTCSSCEEQLLDRRKFLRLSKFQYMLLLRGATCILEGASIPSQVSIHAPLARSNYKSNHVAHSRAVSIHAPLARSNP